MSDHANYITPDGRKVPRVTTILGEVGDSPALVNWKMRQVFNIVRADPSLEFSEAVAAMPTEARDWGSEVHDMLNARLMGMSAVKLSTFHDTSSKACEVATWLDVNGYQVVETEVVVVGDMYGGTIDLVCRHEGHTVIVDLKTGKGIYPNHAAQLAAYCRLWKQRPEATAEVLHAAILHAPRKGPIEMYDVNMRLADRLWQAALDWTTTNPILKGSPSCSPSTPPTPPTPPPAPPTPTPPTPSSRPKTPKTPPTLWIVRR
jgi:Holliday junction resolvase-like predicted endonuclease